MRNNRQANIHAKGFAISNRRPEASEAYSNVVDYGKIRVGLQQLDDAILDTGSLKKASQRFSNKNLILKAIADRDYELQREISNYFYEMSGIYERICRYFAYLYRYDWYVVPYVEDSSVKQEKILKDFSAVLSYLDHSNLKQMCGKIALQVIKNGCYYGYIVDTAHGMTMQELPVSYCRSRFCVGDSPAVEFNMRFFDDKFSDVAYRMKVLKMFPPEFAKGYALYKQNKLKDEGSAAWNDKSNTNAGWYLLDPSCAVKLNLNGQDFPMLVNAIPNILDLDSAQDLDRRKTMQQLLKVVIQKLPLDKNGDLIFDVDEARDIHNNTVQMLKRAVGVDVMTTFADVDVADMSDKNTSTSTDALEKVERSLYNSLGVSQNLFNTDGNLSLEKSIRNDEAAIRDLLLQFQSFVNKIIDHKFPGRKKYSFRSFFLETTVYNYIDLAKFYKEQVQIGYSKMLPQIALGHSQSAVIANAHFENEVLKLYEIMIPPLMSSTMSSEDILGKKNSTETQGTQTGTKTAAKPATGESKTTGRPQKPEGEKSDKTIKNGESAN